MKITLLMGFLVTVFYPQMADAYLDPFTGGYLFQLFYPILTAILAGLLFAPRQVKKLIMKIGALLGPKQKRK